MSTTSKKGQSMDYWQENIHFAEFHADADTAQKLANSQKLVSEHDEFVEYIRHVESKSSRQSTHSFLRYACRLETAQTEKSD